MTDIHERLAEADRRHRVQIKKDLAYAQQDLEIYWSNPDNLKNELEKVTEIITVSGLLESIMVQQLAICSGTGEIYLPMKMEGQEPGWHPVFLQEQQDHSFLLHTSLGMLSEDQLSHLRYLSDFKSAKQ